MIRLLILLAVITLLPACRDDVRPTAVPENCDALCRTPCNLIVPIWTPQDPDSPDAWDSYPEQVTSPVVGQLNQCELHRQACVQCLDRLKKSGLTQ